jgi:hypothetical protein
LQFLLSVWRMHPSDAITLPSVQSFSSFFDWPSSHLSLCIIPPSSFFSCIHHPDREMVMDFRPWRGGLYVFSFIYKKVTKLFFHPHEGFGVALKPLNKTLCLVPSSRTLVTRNNLGTPTPQLFLVTCSLSLVT